MNSCVHGEGGVTRHGYVRIHTCFTYFTCFWHYVYLMVNVRSIRCDTLFEKIMCNLVP